MPDTDIRYPYRSDTNSHVILFRLRAIELSLSVILYSFLQNCYNNNNNNNNEHICIAQNKNPQMH